MVEKYVVEDGFVMIVMASEIFCAAAEIAEARGPIWAVHFECIPPPRADLRAGGVWMAAAAS